MTIKHVEYGKLLYDKVILQKLWTIEFIARRTNTPPSTLYKYCQGTLVVPAGFESLVYNATGDIDFLNFVVEDTDKVLIDRHRGEGEKTVLEETLDVTAAVGHLVQSVQKSLDKKSEGGEKQSRNEKAKIFKNIDKVIKELEDLRTRSGRE